MQLHLYRKIAEGKRISDEQFYRNSYLAGLPSFSSMNCRFFVIACCASSTDENLTKAVPVDRPIVSIAISVFSILKPERVYCFRQGSKKAGFFI